LCGMAAMEMVNAYYGQTLDETEYSYMKLDARQNDGITGATMEVVFRASNYYTAVFKGTLDHQLTGLFRNLDLKRPLIIMVQSKDGKVSHYAVLVGYDPVNQLLVISDPSGDPDELVDMALFKTAWDRVDDFTLLAVPQDQDSKR
jgi:ABC-type bacteriocin/lantibiotic exporter with double-glycine peptidase domain